MGYTSYYRQKRDMIDDEFEKFCGDVKKLQESLPATVGEFVERYGPTDGGLGSHGALPMAIAPEGVEGSSIFGMGAVGFNGAGYGGADHETFWVPQKMGYKAQKWEMAGVGQGGRLHFTKTARKPYDAMVCACLLALKRRASSAWDIRSDGEVKDWASAHRFAMDALGTKILPLEKIGAFKDFPEALAEAREPTPWMTAQRERRDLELQGKQKPRSGRGPGL